MKIRTAESLSDSLSSDLAWRKKELTDVWNLALRPSESMRRKRVLKRCGVALLYAHFEGFTKQAGTRYVEFVAAQRLKNEELAKNFVALLMKNRVASVAGTRKASSFEAAVELFHDHASHRSRLPIKNAINTESNLSSTLLREITWTLGIDYSEYESKAKLIDSRLLGRRNHIAHGEYLDLDDQDYDELHNSVIGILNLFRNQIENAVAQDAFRHQGAA